MFLGSRKQACDRRYLWGEGKFKEDIQSERRLAQNTVKSWKRNCGSHEEVFFRGAAQVDLRMLEDWKTSERQIKKLGSSLELGRVTFGNEALG